MYLIFSLNVHIDWLTRIEPVCKPYREVCLRFELWSGTVIQANSWSKRSRTWVEYVLAYCRVGHENVGCIGLFLKLYHAICRVLHGLHILFCLTVTLTFCIHT